jgi:uncharacterized protein YecE (DUF72 family)
VADLDLRIGCSGWGYDAWLGPFYPKELDRSAFLRTYSKAFDLVEIDSSFYRTPSASMCADWYHQTPKGFTFAAKWPQRITHDHKLRNVGDSMDYFYRSVGHLKEKLGPLCVQLPPSLKYDKDWEALQAFVQRFDKRYAHAVEFRHRSWFREDVYRLLRDHAVTMVWATTQYLDTPPVLTSDAVYLRMIGDRELTEFGSIQRDKKEEMRAWYGNLEKAKGQAKSALVFFNNHYAGFGPASVNEFRRLAGLMEITFPAASGAKDQRSLDGF